MRIGAHVSIAGGLPTAPARAAALGLECFQLFTRPPQGGRVPPIPAETADRFLQACADHRQAAWYVHTPYVLNLASKDERIRRNSEEIIRTDLERAALLGAAAVMTHVGSASEAGRGEALETVAAALKRILAGYEGAARPLIEISAGSGHVIGRDFEEVRAILDAVGDERLGVCFDTAHAFASGYDLRNAEAVADVLGRFDRTIGLDRLAVCHANDSKAELGSHVDRHEHIGRGRIGLEGFRSLLGSPLFPDIDLILETPHDEDRIGDVAALKQLRSETGRCA